MTTSARYLEAAKLEQLAGQYTRDGFDVQVGPMAPDQGYDLVATKVGRRVAIEVKADSELSAAADQIKELRRRAFEQGFDEFRLVVVNPPHETQVRIEGLDERLASFLSNNLPKPITDLSESVAIAGTNAIEVDSITVLPGTTRVVGRGLVGIEIPIRPNGEMANESNQPNFAAGSPIFEDGNSRTGWEVDLPFSFDIELGSDLEIVRASNISVDTSSLFD